ncbi:MAG: YCF48-related protein [Gammaproteobacteria bacterium]
MIRLFSGTLAPRAGWLVALMFFLTNPAWAQEAAFMAPLASSNALLMDAASVDGHIVAVGERGIILTSDDNGASWTQSASPVSAVLTAVTFHDRDLGWAVGHDSVVLKTTDGGDTWTVTHSAPDLEQPLFDVWFADANNGLAIGAYGYVLVSSDGGDSWQESSLDAQELGAAVADDLAEDLAEDGGDDAVDDESFGDDSWMDDIPADYHLNALMEADGQLFIGAERGNIYRSDDQGQTWVLLPSFYPGSFFGTFATSQGDVYVMGLTGHLFRSRDGGLSWDKVETGVETSLNAAAELPDGTIAIVGMSGTLLISRDNGETFDLVQQANRKALVGVQVTDDDGLLLLGEAGVVKLAAGEF